jgi:hypothetical protein
MAMEKSLGGIVFDLKMAKFSPTLRVIKMRIRNAGGSGPS